jgi:hypothetical protein
MKGKGKHVNREYQKGLCWPYLTLLIIENILCIKIHKFEDTKEVIRSRKSKYRKYNVLNMYC